MYIYKNKAGAQLTIDEFIELIEKDLLNEIVSIIMCLDDPESILNDIVELYEESEDDRVNRIMNRLLGELEDRR